MEWKDTLLKIGVFRLFTDFADCYFYGSLIITLQYNFAVNLHEFRFQIGMCVDNLFQCIYQSIRIYSFQAIDKRNVILSGIRILFPFKIESQLVLHQRVKSASLIGRLKVVRRLRKEGCDSPHCGAFHDLNHLDIDLETTLEKCT